MGEGTAWMVRGKGESRPRETVAAGLPAGLVKKEGNYFYAPLSPAPAVLAKASLAFCPWRF